MATMEELKSVLKETLDRRGILGQLKARIRAEVFQALEDHSEERPILTNENLLINELITEYLEFNQYRYTSSILKAESGQPETPLDRKFLAHELNFTEDDKTAPLPLLYGIISHFLHQTKGRVPPCPNSSPLPSGRTAIYSKPFSGATGAFGHEERGSNPVHGNDKM